MENIISIESIVSALRTKRPDLEISVNETIKNKQKLQGITIKSPATNIAPNIYVENYIKTFDSVDAIANAILNTYEEHKCFDNFNVSDILNKDYICEHVYPLLQQASDEPLIKMPIPEAFHGAEAYLAIVSQADDENTFSIKLTPQILATANVDIEADHLFERALANLKEQVVITSLYETIKQLTGMPDDCDMPFPFDEQLYVITNKSKTKGASAILCDDILRDFAKEHNIEDGFFILPSSISECIIVLDNHEMNIDTLSEMVQSVNQNEVAKEDWLASEAWYYSLK
ncbi:DUF5688 family protein [Butyrivibrio sp. AC2005]|uniref:DUF5688 family protein n=1 Tax=Butyrivibrio sp. AC2005 TaxID=1280672 RepID=UPI0004276B8C|nr:DUF5688 family protein [Butyrivibrio sp. AC2005]